MRVMTWNLWGRFGPWEQRRTAILQVLREVRPDVVGLQEVWARGDENLAAWLAKDFGMHWTWAPSEAPERWRRRLKDPEVDIGNAVLSRWPIVEHEAVRLPEDPGREDGRLVLHALLDAPGRRVPFFTVHLSSGIDQSGLRCRQVRTVARFVAERSAGCTYPPVLTGDFNAWPDSDEVRLMGGYRTAPAVPGHVLLDVWEYATPSTPSATWDPANPYIRNAIDPGVRIDYVFVGGSGSEGLGRPRSVRRAGDGPVDGVWPSDHAAVVADLTGPDDEGAPGA